MNCSKSCNGCFLTPSYCIGCADGFIKASNGRCVKNCPQSTYEETKGGVKVCTECSDGCMKCVNEADDCSTDSNPPTGSSSATTGEGVPDSSGTMPPKVARCVR